MLRVADSYPSAGVSALGVVASAPVRRSLGAGSRGRPVSNCRSASPPGISSTTTLRGPTRDESVAVYGSVAGSIVVHSVTPSNFHSKSTTFVGGTYRSRPANWIPQRPGLT